MVDDVIPYTDLTLTDSGFFKSSNNRLLKFSLTDIKRIYKHLQLDDCDLDKLVEYSDLSSYIVNRIVRSIEEGVFDEYLKDTISSSSSNDDVIVNDAGNQVNDIVDELEHINDGGFGTLINGGVHITINNNIYTNPSSVNEDSAVESKEKVTGKVKPKESVNVSAKRVDKRTKPRIDKKLVREWSKNIRKMDNYTCANCGKTDKDDVQAHHIYPQSRFPELACDEGNGITLCSECHKDYHQRYLGSESPYNFIRWLTEFKL